MTERVQQKFWVHTRGVEVLLPPQATANISASVNSDSPIPDTESERLRQIVNDGTLKKRYPSAEKGAEFMEGVCFERRTELLELANEASGKIVEEWEKISPDKPVAVILFGSVAKGLVKSREDEDPSNIDLAVIGEISQDESERLYDSIRPYREAVKERIADTCSDPKKAKDTTNLGVSIQHVDKLSNGHFSGLVTYLGSAAFPMSDPHGIWERVEYDALTKLDNERKRKKQRSPYVSSGDNTRSERNISGNSIEKTPSSLEQTIFIQSELF